MNSLFKRITTLIFCVSLMSGAISLTFTGKDASNKLSEPYQMVDNSVELENKISEEPIEKIDYLTNISLKTFTLSNNKFEINSKKLELSFISLPPFSPPNS